MKGACFLTATAALLLLISGAPALSANADYVEGQKLFAGKNYRAAAAKFESAMRAAPRDANAIYYCALANQLSSNRSRARQLYEYISSSFPGTQVAGMAATALTQLGGAPPTSGTTGGSGSASATTSSGSGHSSGGLEVRSNPNLSCPEEFRVPFERGRGGGSYLDVSVNGHAVRFQLDTGAAVTLIGANQMAELGFGRAAQGQKFGIGGVGEGNDVKAWRQTVQLRVGQASVRDFPITIQENGDGQPLLGQDFLRAFDTETDPNTSQIIFRKKGVKNSSARMARGAVDVPFEDGPGGHMIVTAQVNGKPYKFYFDTGADGVCFAMKDLKPLGLEIPSDYHGGTAAGVAGTTATYDFPINSLKLGTIVKENFMISVNEKASMEHPLLGQSFFGNYRHTVDTASHLIHFWPKRLIGAE